MIQDRNIASRVFDGINLLLICLFTALCVYPFYYMLCYSLSDPKLALRGITLYPRGITLDNFREVMRLSEIPASAMVSVARTLLGTVTTLICSGFFAYLVTQRRMYFRKFLYRMVIVTMYVSGGLIPTYLVIRYLGLRNSFLVFILPNAMSAYYIVLIKTFIEPLPPSMEESARIEGAGLIACWVRIIVPLSKPILATIAVFAMVAQWNAWFDAMIYTTRANLKPLQLILYEYLQEAQSLAERLKVAMESDTVADMALTPETVRMTVTAVITLPILMAYPFMQRFFVQGILLGAVKG